MSVLQPNHLVVLNQSASPLGDRSDDELMLLCSNEQKAAFEILARRYLGRVTSFCGKRTGSLHVGEEMAQEVMLAVWASRHRYRCEGHFAAFVFTLARNRCRNSLRGRGRRLRVETTQEKIDECSEATSPNQLDALLQRERQCRVHVAIAELPERLRDVLLLRLEQGLDYGDIAKVVGRGEATVRVRLSRAVRRLRAVLEKGG
jgi:RNA polymerase sigma-70 factor (ECF subfamily)